MTQFKGKVVIVTGGGAGIGQALCQELGQRGSIVVVADINEDKAKQVASAIVQSGGQARPARVDVSSEEAVRHLIDETISEYGRLDYIFNNAGIAIVGDARDLTIEQWRSVLEVDLYGVLYGMLMAYPIMVKQGFGHIVNTASAAGLLPQPGNAPYCTSKYAIVGLSLSLRAEGADLGVKVSVVCPGYIRTSIYQAMIVANVPREQAIARIPVKMMAASRAAHTILNGVSRNQAIIIFPASVRWVWRLNRLIPHLMEYVWLDRIRNFRKYRLNSSNEASR